MFYAGHTIPTTPRSLAADDRFRDPNWTDEQGFTLKQLATTAYADRHGWDCARAEVAYLWEQATAIAAAPLAEVV